MQPGTRVRSALVGAVLTVLVGTQLVAAGPAWAGAGLERIEVLSASDSNNKIGTAVCPRDKVVIGGGGLLGGPGSSFVHLTGLEPVPDGTGFQVKADEVEGGTGANWVLQTFAMCAPKPRGWHLVTGPTVVAGPATSHLTAQATCASGILIGLGARIDGGHGQVGFEDVRPVAVAKATTTAYEDWNGYGDGWSLTSTAICADASTGVVVKTDTGQYSMNSPKSVSVACTAPSEVYGGGFLLIGGVGNILLNDLVPAKQTTTRTLAASAYRHPTAPIAKWALALYVFCGP